MEVFFTKEKLIHSGVVEDTICPWCTEEDSAMHRHWHCLETAEYRAQLPEQLLADFDTLPECTKQHGWITKPDNMKGYLDMLVALPDRSQQFHEVQVQFPVAHLFTDGSACNPTDRIFRVATWGVVVAALPDDNFQHLAQGFVPGILQTVLRAELWAAIAALQWILLSEVPGIIWVDNQQVYVNLAAFRVGHLPASPTNNDHDLWEHAHDLVTQATAKGLLIKVAKVKSHVDAESLPDPIERRAVRGNHQADILAEQTSLAVVGQTAPCLSTKGDLGRSNVPFICSRGTEGTDVEELYT